MDPELADPWFMRVPWQGWVAIGAIAFLGILFMTFFIMASRQGSRRSPLDDD